MQKYMRTFTMTAAAALVALPVALPAMANNMKFTDIDTNQDGYISKAESDAAKDRKFSDKDTNGDGRVSQAEFDKYWANRQGSRTNTGNQESLTRRTQSQNGDSNNTSGGGSSSSSSDSNR